VIGSLGLLAAAPVMLLVALAIKLDSPGPVFFRQRRHGFNNEAILVWKFRSMRHDMPPTPRPRARSAPTTTASPRSASSSARPASTNCRSCSTCCAARCRWSAPAPTPSA
jgi:lipopolysaccharide/colanic/teichoic acid biosynthesis glycosyltransferase